MGVWLFIAELSLVMADAAIPAAVQRNVAQLEIAMSDLQRHIRLLISPDSQKAVALLSAAERASYFLAIAKATNALFCCKRSHSLAENPL